MQQAKPAIRLNPKDNVAVVLAKVSAGDTVQVMEGRKPVTTIVAQSEIDLYHKIALTSIRTAAAVLKYGEMIGRAEQAIAAGEHVHVDNLKGVTITNADESL